MAKFAVRPQFKCRLKCTRRFDCGKLRHDLTTASTYAIALSNRFEALADLPDGIESAWSSVHDSFRLAAEETFGFVKPHRRLHLSWQKTKLQNLGSGDSAADITVANNTIEAVTEFWYLGSIQSSSGRCYPDLHRRIGVASSIMHSKLRLYQTCVL